MRVLQINNVYGRLSTGKIVADLHHAYLHAGIESYVYYGRGPVVRETNVKKFGWEFYAKVNKIWARITGLLYGGCILSTLSLLREIRCISPDVVHLHCINDNSVNIYRLLSYLKIKKIPTVLTLHAEFLHTGSCGYAYACDQWKIGCQHCGQYKSMHMLFDNTHHAWAKMKAAFAGFDEKKIHITSVSPWLEDRAACSAILKGYKHSTVLNAVETDTFYPRDGLALKEELGIKQETKVALFVTSDLDSPSKGGEYLIELAKRMPDLVFVVLGTPGKKEDLPNNILRPGRIYDQNLMAQYYSMADVTLILSKAETFSMPTAESLCCGTPVAGFKAGGPESIALSEYCAFVNNGDIDAVENVLHNNTLFQIDRKKLAECANQKYRKSNMADAYIENYRSVMGKEMSSTL